GDDVRVAELRRLPARLRRRRHRAQRRAPRRPRHAAHRGHGLRAPLADLGRADANAAPDDRRDGGRRVGALHGADLRARLVLGDGRDRRRRARRRALSRGLRRPQPRRGRGASARPPGSHQRRPRAGELTRMPRLMTDAMEDGAWGLSTGLIYAPGSYSETAEIVAVARAAARYRGFYASHIRGEGATLLDAIREAISVGREGELPVQVSHVKAAGRPNWGNVSRALALIDAARAEGRDVRAHVYPYTASSTTLRTLLPDWALEGGIDAMLKRLTDPAERARVRAAVESP